MNDLAILPMEVEEHLQQFIEDKFNQEDLRTAFPNPVLREDVLDLLNRYCTVLYYPQTGEKNNGFHITDMPFSNGSVPNFVFINTAQTTEKQVFTAAHELGHVWKADEYILQVTHEKDTPEMREMIINRFAAVLLMPCDSFIDSYKAELTLIDHEGGKATLQNVLRLIVALMYHFFAPMRAVALRLLELGCIPTESARLLLGYGEIPDEEIQRALGKIIADNGYTKFQIPSNKKWIEGLPELLNEAEAKNCVTPEKIRSMRDLFDLQSPPLTPEIGGDFSLTIKERLDTPCS